MYSSPLQVSFILKFFHRRSLVWSRRVMIPVQSSMTLEIHWERGSLRFHIFSSSESESLQAGSNLENLCLASVFGLSKSISMDCPFYPFFFSPLPPFFLAAPFFGVLDLEFLLRTPFILFNQITNTNPMAKLRLLFRVLLWRGLLVAFPLSVVVC